MKKRIMALISALVLICGTLGVFAITTGAATTAPEMSIDYCNLSFRNNLCIKYAVKSDVSDVKVLIWRAAKTEYVMGTQDDEIVTYYTESINGTPYKIFDYTEIVAKQMTDVIMPVCARKLMGLITIAKSISIAFYSMHIVSWVRRELLLATMNLKICW